MRKPALLFGSKHGRFSALTKVRASANIEFLCKADAEYKNAKLWVQPREEKGAEKPRKLAELGDEDVSHLTISPDGKTIADAQGGWRHDAVLLKGLK